MNLIQLDYFLNIELNIPKYVFNYEYKNFSLYWHIYLYKYILHFTKSKQENPMYNQ